MTPTAIKAVNIRAATVRYPGAIVKKENLGGTKYTTPKAPRNVASRPGPKPPRIPLAATANVNNNSKACSCRSGSSNSLKANATAQHAAANAYRMGAEAGNRGKNSRDSIPFSPASEKGHSVSLHR